MDDLNNNFSTKYLEFINNIYKNNKQILQEEDNICGNFLAKNLGKNILYLTFPSILSKFNFVNKIKQQQFMIHSDGDDICPNILPIKTNIYHNWLPICSNSLDNIILLHAIDIDRKINLALLQETARVLQDHGQIMIFIFNPFSWLGMNKKMNFPLSKYKWLASGKVKYLLENSNFRIEDMKKYGPLSSYKIKTQMNCYCILARKKLYLELKNIKYKKIPLISSS